MAIDQISSRNRWQVFNECHNQGSPKRQCLICSDARQEMLEMYFGILSIFLKLNNNVWIVVLNSLINRLESNIDYYSYEMFLSKLLNGKNIKVGGLPWCRVRRETGFSWEIIELFSVCWEYSNILQQLQCPWIWEERQDAGVLSTCSL